MDLPPKAPFMLLEDMFFHKGRTHHFELMQSHNSDLAFLIFFFFCFICIYVYIYISVYYCYYFYFYYFF